MIVNPQYFNYRLIIGSLIVVIAALAVYSFTNYQSIENQQQFIEQEKKLVENELSQLISRNDEVSFTNDLMILKLDVAKKETKIALESIVLLRHDLSEISKSREQLIGLKSKNAVLAQAVNSIHTENEKLEKEKILASKELQRLRQENSSLLTQNRSLNSNLAKGALLTANSFQVKAYKLNTGEKHTTNRAINVVSLEVCFTLAKNALAKPGKKDIYIQILNPKNNVVADKGAAYFGHSSLIYSTKKNIEYYNEAIDICIDIKAETNDQPLIKGTYYINVFYKDQKLGHTQIELN